MRIVDFDILEFEKAMKIMDDLVEYVRKSGENTLFFCRHKSVYTVGSEEIKTDVEVVKTDRGGSITYHDEGSLMVYFIFKVNRPPLFYKKVVNSFEKFFKNFEKNIYYDREKPGFYIENRKIASLGFRYVKGISKHGVCLNIDTDLEKFNKIKPCNLDGIKATSLKNEGFTISIEDAKNLIKKLIEDEFSKT